MREAFDGQHQTGRGHQWTNTRYRVYCGVERARLARLVISFRFSFRFGHSGFYNNPRRAHFAVLQVLRAHFAVRRRQDSNDSRAQEREGHAT